MKLWTTICTLWRWNKATLPWELKIERNKYGIITFVGNEDNAENTQTQLVRAYRQVSERHKVSTDLRKPGGCPSPLSNRLFPRASGLFSYARTT